MEKQRKIEISMLGGFALIQIALTIFIFLADLNKLCDTTWFKYGGIVFCFVVSFFGWKRGRAYFLVAGLGFTLIADYFLLVKNSDYIFGVIVFCLVQALYFAYIFPKHWKISILVRFFFFIALLPVLIFVFKINDATVYIAGFYFINLLMNAVDSWICRKKGLLLFAIGLTLFIGCDISVGLHNLTTYVDSSSEFIKKLIEMSDYGMWLFYLPSQTLIALTPYWKGKHD